MGEKSLSTLSHLIKKTRHKYVFFFDLDGTLIDSLTDLTSSANRIIQAHTDHRTPVDQNFVRSVIGVESKIFVSKVLGINDMARISHYEEIYNQDYENNCVVDTKPYQLVLEMLDQLHERNILMAVISNKPVRLVEHILKSLNLNHYFFTILGGDSAKLPKPHADLFHLAANTTGEMFDKKTIIHIGDGVQDIQAAKNFGCFSCWASWGFNQDHSLGPDLVAHSPQDIIDLADALDRSDISAEDFPARFRYNAN